MGTWLQRLLAWFHTSHVRETHTLNWVQEFPRGKKTSIGTVTRFWCESHGSTVAATGASLSIECSTCVPRQSDQDGTVRSIIIIILLLQSRSDFVVDLLVILEGWGEDALGLTRRAGEEGAV
jgi:hypothetical protein